LPDYAFDLYVRKDRKILYNKPCPYKRAGFVSMVFIVGIHFMLEDFYAINQAGNAVKQLRIIVIKLSSQAIEAG